MIGEMDELIVFLMREFGWTYEYTVGLVKTLPLKKLNILIAETSYQKRCDEYTLAQNLVIAMRGKGNKLTDLIGNPPSRNGKEAGSLRKKAEDIGIIMPKGE